MILLLKPKASGKKNRRKPSGKERTASTRKSGDAPTLDEVSKMGRELYHIGTSVYGSLAAGPGQKGKIVYSFDKMTLSKEQVLKIYLYENGGQRNLVMTVSPSDINRAKSL